MLILSLANNEHDSSAVVADDYEILSAVQTERITRIKSDNQFAHSPTVAAALSAAGVKMSDIGAFCRSRAGRAKARYFDWDFLTGLRYGAMRMLGKERIKPVTPHADIFAPKRILRDLGAPENAAFYLYSHHFAHALSALFFTDWKNALLYTADGGGDSTNYSAYHFSGGELREMYGDWKTQGKLTDGMPADSIGKTYSAITAALGYKFNRHEGKITGLAALGEPEIYDELARYFWVDEYGRVHSELPGRFLDLLPIVSRIAAKTSPENAAASVQKLLEEIILKSVRIYLQKTGAPNIGLAGGVFANVALNRKIAELPEVEEVFIFPGMGDEGIAVGGLHQYLLERDGLEVWQSKRRRLKNVYWGGEYDDDVAGVFAGETKRICETDAAAETAARLIAEGKIVALYCGRMEFGPRALGARSILAAATDKGINDSLNKRLTRTEFMPFAPAVLAEDAAEVFEICDANRYAMRFMTITCKVREHWREKIPAVVHADGTARPQIICEEDNPLYAEILREYKKRTGLPVVINTSFNAHEEPIVHTPKECLRALLAGRVDYVAAKSGVYRAAGGRDS